MTDSPHLGADVNAQDGEGNTPLHYGVGNPAVVLPLIAAGADLILEND